MKRSFTILVGAMLVAAVGIVAYGQADIDVKGNGTSITIGDSTPSTADGTDFGTVEAGSSTTHNFAILNTGDTDLKLTGAPLVDISGANAADFAVVQEPTTPVQSSSSTTFRIQFTPGATGTCIAVVTIASDDPDESPYTFTIRGTGVDSTPPVTPAMPDLAGSSDHGKSNSDNITNDNTPTFQGEEGAAEGNSTLTIYSSVDGQLGTTAANADGSWSFTVSSPMSDGTHGITVTATDAAGNVSTPSDSLTVLIDTQPPDAPEGRSPADGVYIDAPSPALSWSKSNDSGGSGVHKYRVKITGPVNRNRYTDNTYYTPKLVTEGTYTWKLYAIDVAGNDSSWSADWSFTIDTTPPSVTAINPSPAMIAGADAGTNAFTLTVHYSETMDTNVAPTIAFPTEDPSATITFNHGSWTDADTYVAWYDVIDADQELSEIDVCVSGARDLAGNTQNQADLPDLFAIDTLNPTVTVSIVAGSLNASDDSSVVNFTFSETVTGFAASDLTVEHGTITGFSGNGSSYSATFTADGGINGHGSVRVPASSYTDLVGNAGATGGDTVNIDTKHPEVTGVTPSTSLITGATTAFTITVDFSEKMDTGVAPSLVFTPTVGTTLNLKSGTWTDTDTYQATYSVADGDVDVDNIRVGVTGAQDINGNRQLNYMPENEFGIDTLNPRPAITVSPATIYQGSRLLTVTVTYDEPMDPETAPVIALTGTHWGQQTPVGLTGWSAGNTIYTATFLHDRAQETIPTATASISAESGATDAAGNAEDAGASAPFLVDLVPPEVTIYMPEEGAEYSLNDTVYADWTAVDAFPGLDTVSAADDLNTGMVSGTRFYTGSVGLHRFIVTATDLAGNTATKTVEYRVVYAVHPGGTTGGGGAEVETGGFLDRSIAGGGGTIGIAILDAVYSVGDVIHASFGLTDAEGHNIPGAVISCTLAKVTLGDGETYNVLNLWKFSYDADAELYHLDIPTEKLAPGIYDLWLGFDDGTQKRLRIQLKRNKG